MSLAWFMLHQTSQTFLRWTAVAKSFITPLQFNGPPYRLQPPPVGLKRPEVIYNVCGSWWSSHKKINICKQRLRHACHHTHLHLNTHSLLQKRNQNFWEMWTQLSPLFWWQNTIAGILFKSQRPLKNSDFTSGNQLLSVSSPRKTVAKGEVLMIVLRSFESIILWGIFSYMRALSVIYE